MAWTYERQEGKLWKEKRKWGRDSGRIAESFFCLMKGRSWSCRLKYCGKIVRGYNAVTGEIWPRPEIKEHCNPDLIDEEYFDNPEEITSIKVKKVQKVGRRFAL